MVWFLRQLRQVVQARPQAVAVEQGKERVTYQTLWQESLRVGGWLAQQGYGPEHLLALSFPKSIDYVIALLATWHCGAAFLPLDPQAPPLRARQIEELARYDGILSELPTGGGWLRGGARASSLAYVIFTSGSSGRPKGVEVTHRGLPNLYRSQIPAFRLDPRARMLWILSCQFDASISDVGCALLSGATLCIPTLPPADLPRQLGLSRISHLDIPPALLHLYQPHDLPAGLSTLVTGGEASSPEVLRRWASDRQLVQVYGPTEATVCCSLCQVDPLRWSEPRLGRPIRGMRHVVVEDELCLAGPGLARGYRNQPELTAQRFFWREGVRFYRTGDRVRPLPRRDAVFLGRVDQQFKLQGRLIEPQEIEGHLLAHGQVARAAVVRGKGPHARLECFYAGSARGAELESFLRERLPPWMVPQLWHRLESLPQTPSGKVDRAALQAREGALESPLEKSVGQKLEDDLPLGCQGLSSLQVMLLLAHLQGQGIHLCADEALAAVPASLQGLRSRGAGMSAASLRQLTGSLPRPPVPPEGGLPLAPLTGSLLLTGGSGFLGGQVLRLLRERGLGPIYCVVRKAGRLPAHPLVVEVLGDISLPDWGLSGREWDRLSQEVTTVFHLAAHVNTILSFEQLRGANLDSLRPLLGLLGKGPAKQLRYASTLSVFVSAEREGTVAGQVEVLREDDDLSSTTQVYGGYAQSKWAAEWLLRQVAPCTIFRYGLLTGHSVTGECSPHDFVRMFCEGLRQFGAYPGGPDIWLDITPVDFAARATLVEARGTIHVANSRGASLLDLVAAMERRGDRLRVEAPERFFARPALTPEQSAAQLALCRLWGQSFAAHRGLDLFQATGVSFELKTLDRLGLRCPRVTPELLDLYLCHENRGRSAMDSMTDKLID